MTAPSKFAKIFLVVLACLHLVLAAAFAMETPYRKGGYLFSYPDPKTHGPSHADDIGAPDERQHANYIRFVLKNHALPVLNIDARDLGEEYESHQPPLYYVMTAAVATVTGQSDVESQSFGQVARIFNCLIGAFGVVGVFFAILWSTKREDLAMVGTAFAALLPMNCALSGAISNDPLLMALISWTLAFCAKALGAEDDGATKKSMIWAAIFAGLACLTKSSGLIAIAGLGITVLYLRPTVPIAKLAGWFLIACLVALPVWLRNQILYGDPLAQKVFKAAFTGSPQKSAIVAGIEASGAPGSPEVQYWMNWVGYWAARSYIGAFGYMDIWLNAKGRANVSSDPNTFYKVLLALIAIAKLSFLVFLRNQWKEVPKAVFVALVMAIVTLLVFVGFNMTYFQAQGRYLLPAVAPAGIVLAIGWMSLCKQKLPVALTLVVLVFGGTTIYALSQLPGEFALRLNGGM